jgi:hypothetical protein
MDVQLQRITTVYVDSEDRVRLSGTVAPSDSVVVIWLSQRLLQRLVPALVRWLEQQGFESPRGELLNSFAQQAARSDLTPQAPVQAPMDSDTWLAVAVDITAHAEQLVLRFRGQGQQQAMLALEAKPLRQWLSIVHHAYCQADWPQTVWPAWVRENTPPRQASPVLWH